jgi:hypothetical protein
MNKLKTKRASGKGGNPITFDFPSGNHRFKDHKIGEERRKFSAGKTAFLFRLYFLCAPEMKSYDRSNV